MTRDRCATSDRWGWRKPLSILVASLATVGCGVATGTPTVDTTVAGVQKVVSLPFTQGLNALNSVTLTGTYPGAPATIPTTPPSGGNAYTAVLPGSETLPAGTQVNLTWTVDYDFAFVSNQTSTRTQSFTIGSAVSIDGTACVRQGSQAPVALSLAAGAPNASVALTVTPASLALPVPTTIPLTGGGNSFNLTGSQLGEGTLTANAGALGSDEAPVRVIPALATATLLEPLDNASDVFYGNPPPPNASTVSVFLRWSAVPGATQTASGKYLVHWRENNGAWTFTNSNVEEIVLSLVPGTVVDWKITAGFEQCSGAPAMGPESQEFRFTVIDP